VVRDGHQAATTVADGLVAAIQAQR